MEMICYKVGYDYERGEVAIECELQAPYTECTQYINTGKKVENWTIPVFEYDPDEGMRLEDYVLCDADMVIVSQRFVCLVEPLVTDHVQFLPVKIVNNETKQEDDTYYTVNTLAFPKAFDSWRSSYMNIRVAGEKVKIVEQYVLKGRPLVGLHMFRLHGDRVALFVSDEVQQVITKNKLTGFALSQVRVV